MKHNRQPLEENIYRFGSWRVTALTSMLFRLEFDPALLKIALGFFRVEALGLTKNLNVQ